MDKLNIPQPYNIIVENINPKPVVKFKKIDKDAIIPKYETPGAVGMDLASVDKVYLAPHRRVLVSTGLAVELPPGCEGQVRSRSGLALKLGIKVLNSPGTIDPDYKGKIGVILYNSGDEGFQINPGDKIAQFVIAPVVVCNIQETEEQTVSSRGTNGFGHTGLNAKEQK